MDTKVVLLRGINVGGNRKILMADLKAMFKDLGFTDIETYIQSGNVIFKSKVENQKLAEQIELSIKVHFDFDVPVIVRSAKELENAIQTNPFYSENSDVIKLHLTFLKDEPKSEDRLKTETYQFEPDKFIIKGKDTFIFCEGKYHESKLSNSFFEKKLKVSTTTRNWKTVLELLDLVKGD